MGSSYFIVDLTYRSLVMFEFETGPDDESWVNCAKSALAPSCPPPLSPRPRVLPIPALSLLPATLSSLCLPLPLSTLTPTWPQSSTWHPETPPNPNPPGRHAPQPPTTLCSYISESALHLPDCLTSLSSWEGKGRQKLGSPERAESKGLI